ncbi:MAG TPA: ROK family protein [Gaiellaceae bacterium]
MGATDVKWAVAIDGALGAVQRTPTRRDSIGQLIDQLCGLHSDAAASEPLPWALCTAGIVDTARGRILWSANLGLEDEPIVERLAEAGSRPRFIVNDVDAAAVGEAAGGTLALLQIGSGVAGRIVVDGAALSSANGYGGEVGHLVYLPGGRPCNCGLAGCVEAYAGMTTIRKRYSELGRTAPSAQQVLADAASDRDAAELLDDALSAIAFAAAVAVIAYDPGTLRLGGGVAAAWGEKLRAAVEGGVADRVPPGLSRRTRFELSRLGERAPLLGLLHLAKST